MNSVEHKFRDLPDYLTIIKNYRSSLGWMFRGQSRDGQEWPLLPKAGRPEYFVEKSGSGVQGLVRYDLRQFKKWRDNAIAFTEDLPGIDFECLAFAQHYGL